MMNVDQFLHQSLSASAKVLAVDRTGCAIPHSSRAESVVDRVDAGDEAQPQLTTISEGPSSQSGMNECRRSPRSVSTLRLTRHHVLYGSIVDVEVNV